MVSCSRMPPHTLVMFAALVMARTWSDEWRIPALHRRHAVIGAHRAQSGSLEQEMTTPRGRQPQPASTEYTQHVAVREYRHIPRRGADARDHPIDALAHLIRALAARATIAENEPLGPHGADLLRRKSLVVAIVPLLEVILDLRLRREARELTGLPCTLQRAAQYQGKPCRIKKTSCTAMLPSSRQIDRARASPSMRARASVPYR